MALNPAIVIGGIALVGWVASMIGQKPAEAAPVEFPPAGPDIPTIPGLEPPLDGPVIPFPQPPAPGQLPVVGGPALSVDSDSIQISVQ